MALKEIIIVQLEKGIYKEVYEWCIEETRWYALSTDTHNVTFYFKNSEDAVAVKLRWL